jgi:large subunit ribosomal protein L31
VKKGIHPDYHPIVVQFTDGERFETRSCWGKPGEVLQLDSDIKTHSAWVGGVHFKKTGQMEKFNARFGNVNFSTAKKSSGSA